MIIILLSPGDLLQHLLTVVFNKLDKGESLDDDFELNTTLQVQLVDSILLLDSLVPIYLSAEIFYEDSSLMLSKWLLY